VVKEVEVIVGLLQVAKKRREKEQHMTVKSV
jgi:hypothetical protein